MAVKEAGCRRLLQRAPNRDERAVAGVHDAALPRRPRLQISVRIILYHAERLASQVRVLLGLHLTSGRGATGGGAGCVERQALCTHGPLPLHDHKCCMPVHRMHPGPRGRWPGAEAAARWPWLSGRRRCRLAADHWQAIPALEAGCSPFDTPDAMSGCGATAVGVQVRGGDQSR